MKVTKIIREYVEEQVSKVYNSKVNPYSEQAKRDRKRLEDFEIELKDQQYDMISQFLSAGTYFEKHWDGMRPKKVCTSTPTFSYTYTQAMLDEDQWNKDNAQKRNAKVREIIVALELGANRQELNDMIANLLSDEEV